MRNHLRYFIPISIHWSETFLYQTLHWHFTKQVIKVCTLCYFKIFNNKIKKIINNFCLLNVVLEQPVNIYFIHLIYLLIHFKNTELDENFLAEKEETISVHYTINQIKSVWLCILLLVTKFFFPLSATNPSQHFFIQQIRVQSLCWISSWLS